MGAGRIEHGITPDSETIPKLKTPMKQIHPRTNLYRLKISQTTIVMRFGDGLQKTVWSDTMAKYGLDSSWMISKFSPDKVVKLTKEETREIKKLIKAFIR